MDRTKWIIFSVICVALIGVLIFTRDSGSTFDGNPAAAVEGDNVYGKRDSKVVLIEYGDFQCPGCAALYPVFKEVKEQYDNEVAFVFRHMPLTNIHPNARAAASAAEAAALQGKFWEMHDQLYENQDRWSSAQADDRANFFESYARTIGLNVDEFRAAVATPEISDRVSRDQAAARKAGLAPSTPTVVLNGEKLDLSTIQTDGRYDAQKLRDLLNKKLEEVGETPPEIAAPENADNTPAATTERE